METTSLILLMLLQAIIIDINLAIAQKPIPTQQFFKCSNNGNFSSDNLLKDRDQTFNLLFMQDDVGSYTGWDLQTKGVVWTRSVCPSNIKLEDCRGCVKNTVPYLNKNCPKQKEGMAWTALTKLYCMVHYADSPDPTIFDWAIFYSPPPLTPANAGELEKGVNNLANKLKEITTAVNNQQRYGFWSMSYNAPSSKILWGSMQCINGLPDTTCKKCLSDATNEMHKCCSRVRKHSGMILSYNCQFWYAHYNFRLL
ncbi:putative Gnk2-like domain-containing protein [Helianthus annuus]|uniref:Gnk2-like domain-containing protein n=2 Tax=Helianthus annuus TaxID=4232 RepID=A0A9K3NDK8_HELAN|nr:putative Gnk2-like domain-containing protein [Helianthus annuus]KAJ0539846.1 putative Gnk2-like domain-containing protein [Helianthus annuus]KAJ0548166.1 putative Gnk2-like domain-containing protein [Helianthus annuus]KAJ0554580.1 putative Gnk2-like domain-containing protein [Helianthus annuus]KAJ0720147.1 putative Gnk2-like domain-containing protein [Helianthus annuus]